MPSFKVETTKSFDKRVRGYASQHANVRAVYADMLPVLREDPYNSSRSHPICKVWDYHRYSKRRWRFFYSIEGCVVMLKDCKLRNERTYRQQG